MVKAWNPSTLEEALKIKIENPNLVLYAGGSDLMVAKKPMEYVLFLGGIPELKPVEETEEYISIGATTTYWELLQNELVPSLLKDVIREIASPAIRNMATVGGNICNASPAGDTLPILYLLDAKLVLTSLDEQQQKQERVIPIEEFILGIRKIDLKPEEILVQILLPKYGINNHTKVGYQKVGARKAQAISKLLFTALLTMEENKVTDFRVAFGSVGVTVIRRKEIEERYIGLTVEEFYKKVPEVMKEYEDCIHPIDDQRSTAVYRKKVCLNLLEDFLRQ